jgi:F0F1-type ATP synthase assembly protein I
MAISYHANYSHGSESKLRSSVDELFESANLNDTAAVTMMGTAATYAMTGEVEDQEMCAGAMMISTTATDWMDDIHENFELAAMMIAALMLGLAIGTVVSNFANPDILWACVLVVCAASPLSSACAFVARVFKGDSRGNYELAAMMIAASVLGLAIGTVVSNFANPNIRWACVLVVCAASPLSSACASVARVFKEKGGLRREETGSRTKLSRERIAHYSDCSRAADQPDSRAVPAQQRMARAVVCDDGDRSDSGDDDGQGGWGAYFADVGAYRSFDDHDDAVAKEQVRQELMQQERMQQGQV